MGRKPAFDWLLFLLGLLLSISGLVYVYSASFVSVRDESGLMFGIPKLAVKQIVSFILAVIMFLILRKINWGLKPSTWLFFYLPVAALLALVLVIGHGTIPGDGVTRWISLGPVDVQPSEFAKLAFIMILSWLFSFETAQVARQYFIALGVMISLIILMLKQPDLGTSMVFVIIFFVMGMFSSVPRRYLLITALAFALLSVPAWFWGLKDYQKARITAFLDPEADPLGAGYHLTQSRIAIGSGGLTGKGFMKGTQVRGDFIPVVESDFIFALVGEEFGLLGCLWLLLLYFLLLARILALSRDALSTYERYICYGSSAVIFFHVFIAVGMTVGLTPITGLPLPFVSYGGSSMMTMWLLLAVNQSIYANSRRDFRGPHLRR